jgi:hypothetical protein
MTDCAEILDLLRQLNQKVDRVDQKLGHVDQKVDQKLGRVVQKVDYIDQEHGRALELLRQDMTLLRQDATIMRATLSGQANTLHDLLHESRMMRAALSDMARKRLRARSTFLHEDVTRLHMQVSELKGRVQILEGHGEL